MAGRAPNTMRKCSICGTYSSINENTVYKGQNYCSKCNAERELDAKAYRELTDYIQKLADYDNSIFVLIGRQIKSLKEVKEGEYALTNAMILSTLKYMYELKERPLTFKPEFGIANVPYYFREAQQFYYQYDHLLQTEEKKIKESLSREPVQIALKRSNIIKQQEAFEEKRKKQKNLFLIDLDDIELEDDGEVFEDNDIINYKTKLEYNQKHKYDNHTYDWGEEDS